MVAVLKHPPGPKPGALKTEPHSGKMADPKGVAPSTLRRQRGALLIELRILKWWEVLVPLQFVASDFVLRHLIYSQAAGSLP